MFDNSVQKAEYNFSKQNFVVYSKNVFICVKLFLKMYNFLEKDYGVLLFFKYVNTQSINLVGPVDDKKHRAFYMY